MITSGWEYWLSEIEKEWWYDASHQLNEKWIRGIRELHEWNSKKYGEEGTYDKIDADEMLLDIMEINGVEDVIENGRIIFKLYEIRPDASDSNAN